MDEKQAIEEISNLLHSNTLLSRMEKDALCLAIKALETMLKRKILLDQIAVEL